MKININDNIDDIIANIGNLPEEEQKAVIAALNDQLLADSEEEDIADTINKVLDDKELDHENKPKSDSKALDNEIRIARAVNLLKSRLTRAAEFGKKAEKEECKNLIDEIEKLIDEDADRLYADDAKVDELEERAVNLANKISGVLMAPSLNSRLQGIEKDSTEKSIRAYNAEDKEIVAKSTLNKIKAQKQKEKEAEYQKRYQNVKYQDNLPGIDQFMEDIKKAYSSELAYEKQRQRTWQRINRHHDFGVKGYKTVKVPSKKIPKINVYFDNSSSWDESDIAKGNRYIAYLTELANKDIISLNIYYFADYVSDSPITELSSTGAWADILANIEKTGANNVIIMTDSDMQYQTPNYDGHAVTVPGYVWWLWRDNDQAPSRTAELIGKRGVKQYYFK